MKDRSLLLAYRTSVRAFIICAVLFSFLGPCASVAAQPALPTVHVNIVPGDDNTPLVYAVQSGMFKQAGLDVQIVHGSGGAAIAAAVLSGTYEIGNSSLLAILNAHLRGLPLVVIGSQGIDSVQSPYERFVVATDSRFRTPKDLDGATIATPSLHDLTQLGVMSWIDRNGGDSRSLRFVELPQPATPAALAEHRVDGAVIRQPELAAALATGTIRAIAPPVYSAIGPVMVTAAFFTTRDYAQQHPEVIRTFMRVMYRAGAYTNAHHAATVQMMADYTKVPAATIARMDRVTAPTSTELSEIQPVIDAAAKYGLIGRAFPAGELVEGQP